MKVIYSCVVDVSYKFQYQGWLWANSLIINACVDPQNIWIHCIKGVDTGFKKLCAGLGINVLDIEPFGDGKYCNKIAQLFNPMLRNADIIVLMDTDTFVLSNFESELDSNRICAKPVDTPNPDISVFDTLFSMAGIEKSVSNTTATCIKKHTYGANFNGGLYAVPKIFVDAMQISWVKWSNWLLSHAKQENRIDFPEIHIDQMSFCMSVHENKFPITELDVSLNFPLHKEQQEGHKYFLTVWGKFHHLFELR